MTFTPSERRTVSLALAILLSALLLFRGIPSWVAWNRNLQESAGIVLQEARVLEDMLVRMPELRDTFETRSERVMAMAPLTIAGDTPDAAAATLGQTLSFLCEGAGLQVESLQVGSDTLAWNDFAELTARLRLTGTYHALLSGLARIETGPPMLSVTALAIRPVRGMEEGYPPTLHIDLTVTGITFRKDLGHEHEQ